MMAGGVNPFQLGAGTYYVHREELLENKERSFEERKRIVFEEKNVCVVFPWLDHPNLTLCAANFSMLPEDEKEALFQACMKMEEIFHNQAVKQQMIDMEPEGEA